MEWFHTRMKRVAGPMDTRIPPQLRPDKKLGRGSHTCMSSRQVDAKYLAAFLL